MAAVFFCTVLSLVMTYYNFDGFSEYIKNEVVYSNFGQF